MGIEKSEIKKGTIEEIANTINAMLEGQEKQIQQLVGQKAAFQQVYKRVNQYMANDIAAMIKNNKMSEDDEPVVKRHVTNIAQITHMMAEQIDIAIGMARGKADAFRKTIEQMQKVYDAEDVKMKREILRQKLAESGEEALISEESGNRTRYAKIDRNKGRKAVSVEAVSVEAAPVEAESAEVAPAEAKAKPKRGRKKAEKKEE